MALEKEHPNSVLSAVGNRSLRTIFRPDGTAQIVYTAASTDGKIHEATFENTVAIAWITTAIATPGTSALIDALLVAFPGFTAADLAPAAAALRIYGDTQALGFAEP